MKFEEQKYYHLLNRTNNEEALFRSRDNYLYFLKKYRYYLDKYLETLAYCLMPTHFHFLVKVKSINSKANGNSDSNRPIISKKIGILLSSYTKSFNNVYKRHGSLFQKHTKSIEISNSAFLIKLINYIHQNPKRSNLVEKMEEWEFSSYRDYIDLRNGNLPSIKFLRQKYSVNEIIEISKNMIYL